jgi:carbonic anhydrase
MKKLLKGIIDFHQNRRNQVKDTFAQLALGQSPDVFFIACSDSRVAVNVFASTEPGDLFVIRNAGNFVTPFSSSDLVPEDESEVAALEFALEYLKVPHIIVCGHSDCGAIKALCQGREKIQFPHLRSWLRHGEEALERVRSRKLNLDGPEQVNAVSKENVLLQMEHLKSYDRVMDRVEKGQLMLHGLWFDIQNTDVYYACLDERVFRIIDDVEGERVLALLKGKEL